MNPKRFLRVVRTVNTYENMDDPRIVKEDTISLSLEKLKSIVAPKEQDPLLYEGYILTPEQLEGINKELTEIIKSDFKRYYYVLECTGIYES